MISEEYITLGQALKEVGVVQTGGAAKWFLQETQVLLNGEEENRRGKKLYPGDQLEIVDFGLITIQKAELN